MNRWLASHGKSTLGSCLVLLAVTLVILLIRGPYASSVDGQPRPRTTSGPGRVLVTRATGGEVHGFVVAELQDAAGRTASFSFNRKGRMHVLPDIRVVLRNVSTGTSTAPVTTDLKGFFMVAHQPPGTYDLCLDGPGYVSGCPQRFTVGSEMVFLPPAPIRPNRGYITGVVSLENGRPCAFDDPAFRVNFDTRVSVTSGGKAVAPAVRANHIGLYLVPAVPAGTMDVRANCEGASRNRSVALLTPGATGVADLQLPNRPPTPATVVARLGARAVRRAAPGATLEVAASADDSDALQYEWSVTGAGAPFASTNDRRVKWTLPRTPGLHSIYVLVRDRRGGVSFGRRDISTDDSSLLFSGTVHDRDGRPVPKAEVLVSGVRSGEPAGRVLGEATTNAAGHFALSVKEESDRYVLTIRTPGFQIFSQVLTAPAVGRRYELIAVHRQSFSGREGGRIAEGGDQTCSPESKRFTDPSLRNLSLHRRLELWHRFRPCGAEVIIAPDSLVDDRGVPAAGTVSAYVSSIDLRDPAGRFPGEYGGVSEGREVAINSVGAVDVNLFDGGNRLLQLAPGRTAIVRIPVDPLQLGMPDMPPLPPPTIPIWFYDPVTGLWNQEGTGTLKGDYYEAEIRHFSTINADLEFATPACMRIHTDVTKLRIPYQLRMSVPAAAPVKVKTETIDDSLSVAVRLPQNTPVKFEALDSAGNVIPLSTVIQSTGATSSPPFPIYDYDTCTSDVTITLGLPTNGGALDYYGLNTADQADTYYAKIDPVAVNGVGTVSSAAAIVTGAGTAFTGFIEPGHIIRAGGQVRTVKTVTNNTQLETETAFSPALGAGTAWEKVGVKHTLDAWKTANGFGGGDDQDAIYLNKPDLGLGRWMHMKKSGGNIAYYVSNYGIPPNFGSADLAAFAKLTNNPAAGLIATVAMEYSPHPTINVADRYTKFYVFNAAGARVNGADLDGNGVKYLPNLCIICHGGAPATTASDARANGLSRFIAFDPESFGYSGFDDPGNPGSFPFTQTAQETEFKEMNRGVRDDTNVSAALLELIEGWYGGAALPSAAQLATYVHKGWRLTGTGSPAGTSPVDKSQLYRDVVRPSCRSCHNTRDGVLSWSNWDGPALSDGMKEYSPEYAVCEGRYMPHAKVTFANFWFSTAPHQPAAMGTAGIDGWAATDPCPTP